jgi:hypothetical protein
VDAVIKRLRRVARVFDAANVPYALIGGNAIQLLDPISTGSLMRFDSNGFRLFDAELKNQPFGATSSISSFGEALQRWPDKSKESGTNQRGQASLDKSKGSGLFDR